MPKIVLPDTNGGFNISTINNNFQAIQNELNNKVLYRDNPVGEVNTLQTNIDANGKRITNLPVPSLPSEAARLQDVVNSVAGIVPAQFIPFTPYLDIVSTNTQGAIQEVKNDVEAVAIASSSGLAGKVSTSDLVATSGAALPGFIQDKVGSVATNVQEVLRRSRNVLDFMSPSLKAACRAYNLTVPQRTEMLAAMNAALDSALTFPYHDLEFPDGLIGLNDANFPARQSTPVGLKDFHNITLHCSPGTVFSTLSDQGADVFQFNGIKNFHVKGFPILTAQLTSTLNSGSNACSITNGYDNITLEIRAFNCQSVDRTTFIDGGKALSIQCDTTTEEVGALKARVFANQCAQGFGFEADLTAFQNKKISIDVELVAEDCYTFATFSAPAASGPVTNGFQSVVNVRGQAINCQKDVIAARVQGVNVECEIITTKSEAARRLDPRGVAWFAPSTTVQAFECLQAKNSRFKITGNKGACAYKASIGGASAGASGLSGATDNCDIFMDIAGLASIVDILPVLSGADLISNSRITMTSTTASTLANDFYLLSRKNTISIGQGNRMAGTSLSGRTSFSSNADGFLETVAIDNYSGVPGVQVRGASSANAITGGLVDYNGVMRFGITNGTGLMLSGVTTAAALGAYTGKILVLDAAGATLGYLPIYA